jgi:hypothetical protein
MRRRRRMDHRGPAALRPERASCPGQVETRRGYLLARSQPRTRAGKSRNPGGTEQPFGCCGRGRSMTGSARNGRSRTPDNAFAPTSAHPRNPRRQPRRAIAAAPQVTASASARRTAADPAPRRGLRRSRQHRPRSSRLRQHHRDSVRVRGLRRPDQAHLGRTQPRETPALDDRLTASPSQTANLSPLSASLARC